MAVNFNIFGKTLEVSDNRDRYMSIRVKYENLAYELQKEYENDYKEQNISLDDVAHSGYDQGNKILSRIVEIAIKEFVSNGIYEIDIQKFFEEYYGKYLNWESIFKNIYKKHENIMDSLEAQDSLIKKSQIMITDKDDYTEVTGTDTASNLITELAQSLFNLMASSMAYSDANLKKEVIFNDPETFNNLSQAILTNACDAHFAVCEALTVSKGYEYGYVSDADVEKAQAIINNLDLIFKNTDDIENVLIQLLELDPFNSEIYQFIIMKDLDTNHDIVEIAKYFNVDLEDIINAKLASLTDHVLITTQEQALEIKVKIEKLMEDFQIKSSIALNSINQILNDFDVELRTFKNALYKDKTSRQYAMEDDVALDTLIQNRLLKFLRESDVSTEQKALLVKEDIIYLMQKYNIQNSVALDEINNILKQIDLDLRTFNGEIYELRELRTQAARDNAMLKNLVTAVNYDNRPKLIELRNEIKQANYTTAVKDEYLQEIKCGIDEASKNYLIEKTPNFDDLTQDQLLSVIVKWLTEMS